MNRVSVCKTRVCFILDVTIHQMAAQGELNMLKQEVEHGES